jgi:transposase-like protein
MAEAILNRPEYQDADAARTHLESLRWPNGAVCPRCGAIGEATQLQGAAHRPGLFKCADCYQQFSVTVGTVFERSKIALNVWLQAVHLMCASKKGISAKQMERMFGVSYKTAWFMSHRIREAMREEPTWSMGGNGTSGIVEADETYWGNREEMQEGSKWLRAQDEADFAGGAPRREAHVPRCQRDGRNRASRPQLTSAQGRPPDDGRSPRSTQRPAARSSEALHREPRRQGVRAWPRVHQHHRILVRDPEARSAPARSTASAKSTCNATPTNSTSAGTTVPAMGYRGHAARCRSP